jgi:hypothetical protein
LTDEDDGEGHVKVTVPGTVELTMSMWLVRNRFWAQVVREWAGRRRRRSRGWKSRLILGLAEGS